LNLSDVSNIIFDLGGVIINLDIKQTETAFLNLVPTAEREEKKDILYASEIFPEYERGNVDDETFVKEVSGILGNGVSKQAVIDAWNAMLLDIPAERLNLVHNLKALDKRVFVLSNTNQIHLDAFNIILEQAHGWSDLDEIFHKAYYSHRMGARKPEPLIFQQVLDEQNMSPSKTLFIDDNPQNVAAAGALGLQTLHIVPPDHLLNHFTIT
jgi:putative hydrolase of the HAD superfamily